MHLVGIIYYNIIIMHGPTNIKKLLCFFYLASYIGQLRHYNYTKDQGSTSGRVGAVIFADASRASLGLSHYSFSWLAGALCDNVAREWSRHSTPSCVPKFELKIDCDLPKQAARKPCLTLRLLMSYIYGAPILDVSRSYTTTQHSR